MFKQKWICKGLEVCSTWITADNYEKYRPFTQVYGVCFTKDGKVMVVKQHSGWIIPGGKPEKDETPEETLKREVDEEASVEIGQCKMIGCCEVNFPNNPNPKEGEHFYQLRYVAIIKEIKELKSDPASGILFERKFINPSEFNDHVKWGDVSKEMFRVAYEYFKNWKKTGKL